nr:hypothetical protein [Tanacetum cinerariifolium]
TWVIHQLKPIKHLLLINHQLLNPKRNKRDRRKQRKEAEVSNDESEDEDHVLTLSSDPLPSGEDSFILNELMIFCSSIQEQGRMIEEIDQNAEIALDDETQGRTNDDEMFGVDNLARDEVVMDTTTGEHEEWIIEDVSTAKPVTTAGEVVTTTVKDSVAPTTDVTEDKITMAQALAALKSIKPKVVVQEQEMSTIIPAAATTVTTTIPTLRAKGIVFHEQKQSQIHTVSSSKDKDKDKGKAKMIKKKDQIRIDEKYARRQEAEEQEASRLKRAQQDEEANNSWDNIQAKMDDDRLLAKRLQAREREEFFEVQKARLSFDEIKKLFDKEMRKVNDFIAMDSEAQKSSTKRTPEHLEFDISKKLKVDENVEPVINDTEEIKKCIEIVLDDRDENFNREDLEVLWAIVTDRSKKEKPVDDMDNLLFRTLKTMFKHHVEDNIWKYQQGLAKVKN